MKILAIETATEACSVALWLDGEVRERFEVAPRGHAQRVLPWAEALLAEAGVSRSALDFIAVGRGPGAFTGVRLAVAIGQGLAMGLDIPLLGISSLAAMAQAASGQRVVAAIDARMREVYVGHFERDASGLVRATGEELLLPPDRLPAPEGAGWCGVGSGFAAEDGLLSRRLSGCLDSIDTVALPSATAVAQLAADQRTVHDAGPPESVAPAYLRNQVALTLSEQQANRASAQARNSGK
jgi:tRNA threonylcarbamoyladenosine biosynthesis protein TsaB